MCCWFSLKIKPININVQVAVYDFLSYQFLLAVNFHAFALINKG